MIGKSFVMTFPERPGAEACWRLVKPGQQVMAYFVFYGVEGGGGGGEG